MPSDAASGVALYGDREQSHRTSHRVVHLLDRFDDDVLRLLGPTTDVLVQSRHDQVVVLIDDPRRRSLLARFDMSVELVLVPPHRDMLMQWRALGAAFARTLAERPVQAIHLHGFVASLIGEYALRDAPQTAPIFYSPHASRSLRMRGVAGLARLASRAFAPPRAALAIGHGTQEARALQIGAHREVQVVEGPVAEAYFAVEPNAARYPLVVASNRVHNVRAIEAFDQLAVLLGSGALRLGFNWLGPVNEVSAARLRIANVGVFDALTDAERAARLAAAWVYVALGADRGFPLSVAEAMAAGVPCVVLDAPAYRDVVQHGETGYLCRDLPDVIDRIAQLIDTTRARHRMSRAARAVARQRFTEAHFRSALLAAYRQAEERRAAQLPAPDEQAGHAAVLPAMVPAVAAPAAAIQECP